MASYLRELNRDGLPLISGTRRTAFESTTTNTANARKIRALEQELALAHGYRSSSPTAGILRYDTSTQARRSANELEEQLRSYREELRKKDALIQHLASVDSAPTIHHSPDIRLDTLYQADRGLLDTTRGELAAMQVKFDRLSIQLRDAENELEVKTVKIKELQAIMDSNRSNEMRLSELVQTLKDRVRELEDKAGSYESVAGRSELAVHSLQHDYRDQQERVQELETRLRKQLEEREAAESRSHVSERKLADIISQISGLLRTDSYLDLDPSEISVDIVVRKVTDLMQENAMLKGKLLNLNEALTSTELETKASRETIMRLVSEVGREQKVATRYTAELENIRMERDNALAGKRDMEREIDIMKERLNATQRSLEATQQELELRQGRLSHLDREVRETSHNVHSTATQYSLFREQIAALLSNAYTAVHPSEDSIKDAVRNMMHNNKELEQQAESLDSRVRVLSEQLENQIQLQRESNLRAKQAESDLMDMQARLRSAEGELVAGDVLRDGFKTDKETYLRILQRLGEKMKMDRISVDLGLDMTMDALIARAEQLVKLENEALAGRSTQVYNLQRKVKGLREQLESKELHIDLLRKKMSTLEERLHGRGDLLKERDNESLRTRKLEKLVDKYKLQLNDTRQELINMKAQLLGSSELQMRTIEQRKDIEELAKQVEELETLRRRQAHKISELKSECKDHASTYQEKQVVSENAVHALSSELRSTKNTLDIIQQREKQLVDFRNVVSRMLGLDMNTLAVPDYEIISRLEKLIGAHHAQVFTTTNLEEALADMEDGFVSDYDASRRIIEGTDPLIKRSRDRSRRKAAKAQLRARSLSPQRRVRVAVDPRAY
ncbi:coiled-coil domain-containing protein 170-like [Gigantopelta aegis]|uniref:coiled-coil domain-containing protein 170-like n=1 Tax=Gigantopelta aegis TaxID=1735272 RepID=UPI001B88E3D1|nr:coiled-coil domain-containing protein 170-like [Gigantopelta aegis]